ncbi:MAG: HesA/MoeB/ThiF family protein, partial [Pseudomonadota bacterium]
VGAGGLGASLLSYLAAAGVGHIGIVDHDRVELSNLQRQIIFEHADIGRLKVEAAKDRLSELNPELKITVYPYKITPQNAEEIIAKYDIIADGSDNFATRFAVNSACHNLQRTLVSGDVRAYAGQMAVFKSYLPEQPCYRCFVGGSPDDEQSCSNAGIIGATAGIIGSLQALQVTKELLNIGESFAGQLLLFDAISLKNRIVKIGKDSNCQICGGNS